MIYQTVYKCRLCGQCFTGACTGNETLAMSETINAACGFKSTQPMAPHIRDEHKCNDGSYGVADFQGFKRTE